MNEPLEKLALYETDPPHWTLATLQQWITEAERLLERLGDPLEPDGRRIRRLLESDIAKKRALLAQLWRDSVKHRR